MPKTSDNKTVAISYIRASTNAEIQANSFGVQEYSINALASQGDYKIVARYSEYVSASKKVVRTEWIAALNYITDNPGVFLLVHDVSRATRNFEDWLEIEKRNLLPFIRFANMGNTEPNILLVHVLVAVASAESRQISSRTKLAIAKKKRDSLKHGKEWRWGNPNLGGYDSGADEGRETQRKKAKTHALITTAYVKDSGCTTLVKQVAYLNSNRLFTRRGNE